MSKTEVIMTIWEKITNALSTWTPMDMLIVGTLVLIPLITLVLIIVTIANGKKRKAMKAEKTPKVPKASKASKAEEEPVADIAAPTVVVKKERRIRHITTYAPERVKVRVRVKNLCKV